ncbi:hypothetical protein AB6A40_009906 [Gnathostoma spinigerum]|uniref:Uncharacterized protein n=1 Tax=Gnathostoma spinigerum TaxID=75299 RepID=A0ABD6F1P8_9BILA
MPPKRSKPFPPPESNKRARKNDEEEMGTFESELASLASCGSELSSQSSEDSRDPEAEAKWPRPPLKDGYGVSSDVNIAFQMIDIDHFIDIFCGFR